MSKQPESEIESQSEVSERREKTKEDYSRNVKKLKVKLAAVQSEIATLQRKVQSLSNTSNDKLISLKILKFCKERRFTPEMLFRFADRTGSRSVSKIAFEQTLAQLGLNLSKDELLRLQYLLDEDLSGQISYEEYSGYLEAFGMRKEFSAKDQLARDALQKLDVQKVLQMAEENAKQDGHRKNKNANLLNYEQFIKYCHKHFPSLKNKQLASIFTRLQKNQLINLQDLADYLQAQEQEKKRLEQRNKKKLKREDSKLAPLAGGQRSLKTIIEALLRCRPKEASILFHSLEFVKLERLVGAKRGELLQIFQQVDIRRKGSFTHNQLIIYFINKSPPQDLPYSFSLMAHKLGSLKQLPEAVVAQYARQNADFLTENELRRLMEEQFGISAQEYTIISKLIPREQDGRYSVERVADLLRAQGSKKAVLVKPNGWEGRLIFRSAKQALRCCLEIEAKLAQLKQLKWQDYQFGPTESDEYGAESLNMPMPSEQVEWVACEDLGMMQFFAENLDTTYSCSAICPHQNFAKTLFYLVTGSTGVLWSAQKPNAAVRDIQQRHLQQIFSGIHPLAFHHFAKYGIFVARFFLKQKWRYVVTDSKVPVSADKTPFFTATANRRYSFLSLIEKAYAKLHGSYHAVFTINSPHQYVIELANILPFEYSLQKTMPEPYKNVIWDSLLKLQKDQAKAAKEGRRKALPVFAVLRVRSEEIGKQVPLNIPFPVEEVFELPDSKCKNTHKSHRLMLLRVPTALKEEASWNRSWNREEAGNKWAQMSLQVGQKPLQPALLKSKTILLVNYKLFRSLFTLYRPDPLNFNDMIILRKELQFQEKFKCRYQIAAKSDLEFLIVLSQRSILSQARILIEAKQAQQVLWRQSRREQVAARAVRIERGQEASVQFSVQNWKNDVQYRYSLTFYMRHPRYQLKQRDRHMLFRYVSPYQEESKLDFSQFGSEEQQFVFRNFYKAAERRGCCG